MLAIRGRALVAAGCLILSAAPAAQGNGPHVNFMLHCQGCHLPDGVGHPGIVPRMKGEVSRFLGSEAGRAYLIQVPGVSQSFLDDEQLAEVLNWMLPEFDPEHFPADFKPYTAAEVARYRATPLVDASAARRALLGADGGD